MNTYEPREGAVHGLTLNPEVELADGTLVGRCACGGSVSVEEFEDQCPGEVACEVCGRIWRLAVVVQVTPA